MRERTQEIRVEVSEDGGRTYRQIVVQEYTFSPRGATYLGRMSSALIVADLPHGWGCSPCSPSPRFFPATTRFEWLSAL
jgi:hypothetical protein